MEFKGTKGNWQCSISNTGSYIIIVDNIYQGTFRDEYNALLISKAPEILKELVNEVEILKAMGLGDTERCKRKERLIKEATEL